MRVILRFVIVLVLVVFFTSSTGLALSPEQKRLFQSGVYYFDIDTCANVNAPQGNTGQATGKIYMIGDSITNGTQNELRTAFIEKGFGEVIIDGVDSRRLSQGADTLDGVGVLERSASQIAGANTVIVALGTNGGVTSENIQESMEIIKREATGAKVYWVNIGVDNSKRNSALDANSINAILQENSSQDYTIIDWASQVQAHPDYIANDGLGVHPSNEGKVPFAGTVASGAISGGAVPSTTPNAGCACSPTGSSTTLVGADNAERVYNFLVGKGLTPIQAAGILGNMMAESSIQPMRLEGTASDVETPADQYPGGNIGWGLVQWTPGSKMIDPTIAEGKDPNDLGVQLEFLWNQLEGNPPLPEKAGGDAVKSSTTIEEAVKAFESGYERPNTKHPQYQRIHQFRIDSAHSFLAQFGSNTGGVASGGSSTCGGGGNGQVIGGFSLPVDRKWYDENQVWFTKPHHTYPAADIPVPEGTPIYSMTAGKVIKAPAGDDCGNGLIIDAAPGIRFTYCHGSDGGSIDGAREGDTVQAGQLIMHSSHTGRTIPTGPAGTHLHLSIDVVGKRVCPQSLFTGITEGSPPDLLTLPVAGCIGS